jgi:two-component sensor histidine kinase
MKSQSQGVQDRNGDSTAELQYLANLAGLITELTSRFLVLGPESLDKEINNSLKEIGEFAAADRSYVFQFSDDGTRVSNTHEWCAPGIEPAINNIQDAPFEQFQWALSPLMRGEVLYIGSINDLPPDAASVKAELERQNIKSLINLPLICTGEVLGFVGFDSVQHSQYWTSDHIKLLKVVGEIIAGAIVRNRATAALKRRVEMETLVATISAHFINVPISQLEGEIKRAISEIGRFTGVDRSYIFQLENGGGSMSNTDEWCADGIEPHIDRLQGLPVDAFAYSMELMRRGEIFYVADVDQMPSAAANEQAEFMAEGIKTLINVPIMLRGEMAGFLGFDAVRRRNTWSKDDIRLLKLVSEIFANALDRNAYEKQLQKSLGEKEMLLREIHHRVKNNMQIIDSLLYLQAQAVRSHADPIALEAFAKSQSRIKSMAAIHERLYRSQDLSSIDFGEYLHALINEVQKFYDSGNRVRVNVTADTLFLSIDQAIPCGLIINELVNNSLRHGFPNNRAGTINVSLQAHSDGSGKLTVADDGVGVPDELDWDSSVTMGLRLVRDLARQLGGQLVFDCKSGTRVQLVF